ncbi:colanic acid biosynthesis glycosyl transferase WcaI [Rhodopirellula sallentina SM41]|uniref:Colanic acid biosynthesis glycosyl transferase WcaI n=1 Tax=Rhodopirellula sallentina SM41 TaxID=1263870 RepID=M5UDW7_9BACT|nr:colanic acid biosynthesis glycosyl transferase WcaI [Rhodopirellula sallentina SM41]
MGDLSARRANISTCRCASIWYLGELGFWINLCGYEALESEPLKILLHGLNFSPEEIGIGKYSGEMVSALAEAGHEVVVVTTPPYYPQWAILPGFSGLSYRKEWQVASGEQREQNTPPETRDSSLATRGSVEVIRCPLWVPGKVTGLKRILHLASFGLSSIPAVLWKAITFRPDVILTVEPAAMCMPTTWFASRLCGAKCWLHVQDFEIDAAFELGILKQPLLKRLVLAAEGGLMRRFDRVSSISPNMLLKLIQKGVNEQRVVSFPNWVDCEAMKPLVWPGETAASAAILGAQAGGARDEAVRSKVWDDLHRSPSGGDKRGDIDCLRESFAIPSGKCVALYSGNMGAKQGLELIVEAARRTVDNTHLHYVLCGTGASFQAMAQACENLPNVQMLPLQPFERFNSLMNCADIHLLPQRAGAADLVMPSKLTGMLATGRPVVACADPGTQISDVVQGHGVVVKPDDASGFTHAIEELAHDSQRRVVLGMAARRYALDFLGHDAILGNFVADLEELVGGASQYEYELS